MSLSLRNWFQGWRGAARWQAVSQWCEAQGWVFKTTRERDGFVVEHAGPGKDIRIEWGPSQRRYLGRHELRLRAETGLDPQCYALLMPKALMDGLEREVFVQFTGGVQTRLDEETPEEMRWLAMSARLGATQMGPLRTWFAAVGNGVDWLMAWLHGPMGDRLLHWGRLADEAHAVGSSAGQLPTFALLVYRGHLVMRRALSVPDVVAVREALGLFELALEEARRLQVTADAPPRMPGAPV